MWGVFLFKMRIAEASPTGYVTACPLYASEHASRVVDVLPPEQ